MKLFKLTEQMALRQLQDIEAMKKDYEAAHAKEDKLYLWFVLCVSKGMYETDEAQRVAKVLQKSKKIDFERYCA